MFEQVHELKDEYYNYSNIRTRMLTLAKDDREELKSMVFNKFRKVSDEIIYTENYVTNLGTIVSDYEFTAFDEITNKIISIPYKTQIHMVFDIMNNTFIMYTRNHSSGVFISVDEFAKWNNDINGPKPCDAYENQT